MAILILSGVILVTATATQPYIGTSANGQPNDVYVIPGTGGDVFIANTSHAAMVSIELLYC